MNKTSERRTSLRRPIYHEALMQTDDGLDLNCVITDFCLDGMFIKFLGSSVAPIMKFPGMSTQNTEIDLFFAGEKGQPFQLRAEIVHSFDAACGLRFIKRYDQAVQSLVNISVNSGISVEHSFPVQKILESCIQYIDQEFGGLLNRFWISLEELMCTEASRAINDQAANALMALSETIKKRQNQLQAAVMGAVKDPVAAFNLHLEKRKAMSDRLSLIDKQEFEDWLLARVLIMRCEADYQSWLLPLKLRLDALGVGDKRHHQSVFGPALLVSAFHPVVQALVVDSATEKQIFKHFEQSVMVHLDAIYEGLNSILVSHNILPKLNMNAGFIVKQVQAIKPQTTQAANELMGGAVQAKSTVVEEKPAGNQHSESTSYVSFGEQSRAFTLPPFSSSYDGRHSANRSVFAENQQSARSALVNINHLLQSLKPRVSAESALDSKDNYSISELDTGLTTLQQESKDTNFGTETRTLMERVKERLLQSGQEKSINESHQAAIDVVDRFFLSMRHNPRISDEAKQFLLKLDVPILKVFLKNETFFDDYQSTARAVMNRIAQLGAEGAKLNPASKEKVSKLVSKIVENFQDDTAVFDEVLAELDQLLERQNKLYVKNVERVAAAADGAFKVEEATVAVAVALNERIAHKFVPSAVITLLNEGWKDYLTLMYIRHGGDSLSWQDALSVIDRLLAYGEDPRMPIDIKVLLPRIQEGLKQVSGNNAASIQVRDALKAFILNAPKGKHLSEQAQQLTVPEAEEDKLKLNIHKSQQLKNWILKVKAMPLGAWFTFTKQSEQTVYMRLVWVAKGFSKFVFVNHQGMKVIELGLFRLASYFKDGLIKQDSDYELSVVDQGLDDMVKDVYDKLAYQSSHDAHTGLIKKAEFCRQVRLCMKQGKRTSSCSMIFIRFMTEHAQELKMTRHFANQVVSVLENIPAQDVILGRLSETDFVLFSVVSDTVSYRLNCQEALIALCLDAEQTKQGLMVRLGESRAHLGFQNPESMIGYACEAITASLVSDKGGEAPQFPADALEPYVQVIDEAANTAPDEQEFSTLSYEIYCQSAATVIQQVNGVYEAAAKPGMMQDAQLNLMFCIRGEQRSYQPENEASARALDKWWVNKLVELYSLDHVIYTRYEMLRVSLSAYAFKTQDTIDELINLAQTKQLDASKICFEVYDCIELEDVELTAIRMQLLKDRGFRFCLDHFGTERCPFAFLKALPVDLIKMDEVFIAALNQEPLPAEDKHADLHDVSADSIIEVAHYMGKQVLAASVDSAVCLQKMMHMKADFVQGSTVSKLIKFDLL